ncbi:MAG: YlxR family protein [Anaerolineales bacterium]
MAKHKAPRVKHIPQRTCVACREVQAKAALVRLVRTPEGVFPDMQGKRPGRGAYLHARRACWEPGLAGQLANALRTALSEEDQQRLRAFFEAIPE